MRNGFIMVNVSPSIESLDLSLTIFSNEIPVVGDTKTELSATITFKLKNYKGVPSPLQKADFLDIGSRLAKQLC